VLLEPSPSSTGLPFGDAYGTLGETGGNRLVREIRASLTLFGFKISKSPNHLAGHIDADILRRSVGITD
jgi:hypothetical protein